MKNFSDHLEEGRDSPLYHGAHSSAAWDILKTNTIEARTAHQAERMMIDRKSAFDSLHTDVHHQIQKLVKGVSLSRSQKVAIKFTAGPDVSMDKGVVFELDQRRLAQNHRIYPVQFMNISPTHRGSRSGDHEWGQEQEEFVIGPIKNLDKYLVRLHLVYPKSNDPLDDWRSHFPDIIRNHPKLYFNGKQVNG